MYEAIPMPFNENNLEMEEYMSEVAVIDVYDLASDIGKEFERIIDTCGADVVTNLMPKVINALEHLESLATKNERENVVLEDMKNRILKLENDKHIKAEDRLKFEKELEQIEEDWKNETKQMLAVISRLQEENKKLSSILADKTCYDTENNILSPDVDIHMINQLQNQVDQLREKVKMQNLDLNGKNSDIDNLENQIEHLNMTVKELRRKQRVQQSQIHALVEERAEFLTQIQDQQRETLTLRQRLGIAQKENEDLSKSNEDVPDLKNKVIYDTDDPNRPRFTVQELKEILYERNELKARVSELEDELALYRPNVKEEPQGDDEYDSIDGDDDVHVAVRVPDFICKKTSDQCILSFFPKQDCKPEVGTPATEDDLAVQGPLPYEPDDAPWKRSESGIRKFFRKLFDTNTKLYNQNQ